MEKNYEQTALDFINALQHRTSASDVMNFYHPDIEQTEFPNAITKNTAIRNFDDLLQASERGKNILLKEEYEIIKTHAMGNTVIVEALWTGTIAIPIGKIEAGGQLKAHFAQFFEFKDGKIFKQRNYDCFEPFT